jgi:hypothetical protein
MTAATKDRDTREIAGHFKVFPIESNTKIFGGTLVCVNPAGRATKGITAVGLKCAGVAHHPYDNTAGAANTLQVEVKVGVLGPFANSAAADQLTNADTGSTCYIVDDQSVAKTDGGGTRSAAGRVWTVEPAGVWISF